MKQLTSRKNKRVHLLTDEEFEKLKQLGLLKNFTWCEVEPLKKVIITPRILKSIEEIEVKKKVKKKLND
jgi:hypothetical protein